MGQSTTSRLFCLELILPDDIQPIWHLIREGLQKIHEKTKSTWIPEDVYIACRTGASKLHVSYANGDYAGFCVLTPSQHYDGTVLHVWCAYSASGHDVVDMHAPDLERIARNIKAKRITFWSPRKWDRRIAKYGYRAAQTEYVKELL
jgi:hypothetical protein